MIVAEAERRLTVCAACNHCRAFVCERMRRPVLSFVNGGGSCPIGKHSSGGERWHWLSGAFRAVQAVASLARSARARLRSRSRMAICRTCDRLQSDGRCAACGCWAKLKAAVEQEKCPLGKWS